MRATALRNRILKAGALALLIVLAMAVAAPAIHAGSAIVVSGASVSGSNVVLAVKNTTLLPTSGYVTVKAVVGDTAVWSFALVALSPGQTSSVYVPFSGKVLSVCQVSLSQEVSLTQDGSTPF